MRQDCRGDASDSLSTGLYPLFVGLYDVENHDRLPIFDRADNAVGDVLELTQITVLEGSGDATGE